MVFLCDSNWVFFVNFLFILILDSSKKTATTTVTIIISLTNNSMKDS